MFFFHHTFCLLVLVKKKLFHFRWCFRFKGNSIFFFWISDTMCQELIVARFMSEKSIWKWGNKFTWVVQSEKKRKLFSLSYRKVQFNNVFYVMWRKLHRAIIQLLKSHSKFQHIFHHPFFTFFLSEWKRKTLQNNRKKTYI